MGRVYEDRAGVSSFLIFVGNALIAMAKWYPGEMAVQYADEALQMHKASES